MADLLGVVAEMPIIAGLRRLVAVDATDEARARALREGLYLARIHDETFELQVPEGFVPRAFSG